MAESSSDVAVEQRPSAILVPPVAENTRRVPAGAITFGVEHRILNDAIVDATIAADIQEKIGISERRNRDDEGWSVHVFGTENEEYLRFDGFSKSPHYHYIIPGVRQFRVRFDAPALGDFLAWTQSVLRARLPEMLTNAGAGDLASQLDPVKVASAMVQVEGLLELARGDGGHA